MVRYTEKRTAEDVGPYDKVCTFPRATNGRPYGPVCGYIVGADAHIRPPYFAFFTSFFTSATTPTSTMPATMATTRSNTTTVFTLDDATKDEV